MQRWFVRVHFKPCILLPTSLSTSCFSVEIMLLSIVLRSSLSPLLFSGFSSPRWPPLLSSAESPRRPRSSSYNACRSFCSSVFRLKGFRLLAPLLFSRLYCFLQLRVLNFLIFLSFRVFFSCADDASSFLVGHALGRDCDQRPTYYMSTAAPSTLTSAVLLVVLLCCCCC